MILRMLQWIALAVLAMPIGLLAAQPYDPLVTAKAVDIRPLDLDVQDEARNRSLPIRVYISAANGPVAVILFSHGLGGSREGNAFMGQHWAAHGYAVVFIQHPGSDESVWKDKPRLQRMSAMRKAASVENFLARVKDVPAVLNQLQKWSQMTGHPLAGRLDMERVGMSGHSFGAITTQAMGGQTFESGRLSYADNRIKAAVMFSPSSPRRGGNSPTTFGQVSIPWMLMTGTKDVAMIGDADLASRLGVFPALPPVQKYELVLDRAEHSAFTERALPGESEKRNPNHHRVILALSTAFWDAYLKENAFAKAWLNGEGPRTLLEPEDRWQKK
jgi:predicted dienelactone hydrolase